MATSMLHRACRPGTEATRILALLGQGCDVNEHGESGIAIRGATPLILAAYYDLTEIAAVLLEHNADVTAIDASGKTAIERSVEQGSRRTTNLLLEAGSEMSQEYQLIYAAQTGNTQELQRLLDQGVDIDFRDHGLDDSRGGGPVIWAAAFGNVDAVEKLLASKTEHLQSALTEAIIEHHSTIATILRTELSSRGKL